MFTTKNEALQAGRDLLNQLLIRWDDSSARQSFHASHQQEVYGPCGICEALLAEWLQPAYEVLAFAEHLPASIEEKLGEW